MHLFLNGLAASAGGGLTYLRNVVPELSNRAGVRATIVVSQDLRHEFEGLPNISCVTLQAPAGALLRFWREQTNLGRLISESGADLLISAGNFALRNSPVCRKYCSREILFTPRGISTPTFVLVENTDFCWIPSEASWQVRKSLTRWAPSRF